MKHGFIRIIVNSSLIDDKLLFCYYLYYAYNYTWRRTFTQKSGKD